MLEPTQNLLRLAESLSGFSIEVMPNADMKTVSSVRMARGELPLHIISYRPEHAGALDYIISLHCGFIIRRFELPPEQRADFAPSEKGLAAVAQMTQQLGGAFSAVSAPQSETVSLQLLGFLGTHLCSIPICLRVDTSIRERSPALLAQQETIVHLNLNENQQVLAASVRQRMPKPLFDASASINAAMAQFWADAWAQPAIAAPYELAGYANAGKGLLDARAGMGQESTHDRSLIDAWARQLGICDWFQWVRLPETGN